MHPVRLPQALHVIEVVDRARVAVRSSCVDMSAPAILRRCACAAAGPSRRAASALAQTSRPRKRDSRLDTAPELAGLRGIVDSGKPLSAADAETLAADIAANTGKPLDFLQKTIRDAEREARTKATDAPDLFGPGLADGGSAFEQRLTALDPSAAFAVPVPPLEDPLLVQFVGLTTKHGLKQRARRLATDVLDLIRRLTNRDPMPIFRMAVERAMPLVGLRQVKVTAMKKAAVPTALRERQRIRLAINAILANADRTKPGRQRAERVAAEMLQICLAGTPKDNAVLERKYDLHRTAVAARSNVPGARGSQARWAR